MSCLVKQVDVRNLLMVTWTLLTNNILLWLQQRSTLDPHRHQSAIPVKQSETPGSETYHNRNTVDALRKLHVQFRVIWRFVLEHWWLENYNLFLGHFTGLLGIHRLRTPMKHIGRFRICWYFITIFVAIQIIEYIYKLRTQSLNTSVPIRDSEPWHFLWHC